MWDSFKNLAPVGSHWKIIEGDKVGSIIGYDEEEMKVIWQIKSFEPFHIPYHQFWEYYERVEEPVAP